MNLTFIEEFVKSFNKYVIIYIYNILFTLLYNIVKVFLCFKFKIFIPLVIFSSAFPDEKFTKGTKNLFLILI